MGPFTTLGVTVEASDEEVAARYRELVLQYPPDRSPKEFSQIREAYEAIADQRSRLDAELFFFDVHGRALGESLPVWRRGQPRRRLTPSELTRALASVGEEKVKSDSG